MSEVTVPSPKRKWGVRLNPVIVRELRAQMRGPRAFVILSGYLLVLSLLTYGIYRFTTATLAQNYGTSTALQSAVIGKLLFVVLAFLDLLLICFITPALTSGALSGEHERGTYDLLMATPLSPTAVFWGKFIPSMVYAFLLVLASIPTFSIAYLFGGVTVKDMVQVVLILTATAVMLGAMALWLSSIVRRTARATVLSYVLVAFILFGTLFIWLLQVLNASKTTGSPFSFTPYALYLNPLSALGSAILGTGLGDYYYGFPFSLFSSSGPLALMYAVGMRRPLWQYTLSLYATLTLLFYLLALQPIKPIRRWRFNRRELAQALLVLVAVGGLGYVTFGTSWASTGLAGGGTIVPTPVPAVPVWRERIEVVPPAVPEVDVQPTDPDQATEELERFVAGKLFPEGDGHCLFFLLEGTYTNTRVDVSGAIFCQRFSVQTDGRLEAVAEERHAARAALTWEGGQWVVSEMALDEKDPAEIGVDWDALRAELGQRVQSLSGQP